MRLTIRDLQPIMIRVEVPGIDHWHPSMVLDYEEERALTVSAPAVNGQVLLVDPGTPVTVEVILPDGLHRFSSAVRRRTADRGPALVLDWPADATRIQRRDFVRVNVSLRAQVMLPRVPGEAAVTLDGETRDVSAGGLRILLPQELEPGLAVDILLHVPDEDPLKCPSRVIRSGGNTGSKPKHAFWVAFQFVDLPEANRRVINKFVFDVQRAQLRNKL